MNRYMAQFIMDRFIEFEIQQPQAKGLKIPVTAVTEKNFTWFQNLMLHREAILRT